MLYLTDIVQNWICLRVAYQWVEDGTELYTNYLAQIGGLE
jgi:hypothetical protein